MAKIKTKEPHLGLAIDLDYSTPPPVEEPSPVKVDTSDPLINTGVTDTPSDEPKKRGRKPGSKNRTTPEGEPLIDGETLLLFIDIIIPMLISTAHKTFTGTAMSPDDLMLTEKQKSQLKVFADKVCEKIDVNVNPFAGLFVGLAGIYAMNYVNAKK